MKTISILIPVFNEEENIESAYQILQSDLIAKYAGRYEFEILFTDNHSTDRSSSCLELLAARDSRVKVIRFSRNFGYQNSIYAAYVLCSGDAAIQLDCDLQDPPSVACEFIEKWESGYDVVYGIREKRKEGLFFHTARRIFYRLIAALSEDSLPIDAGDFRLVSRRIIEELRLIYDANPYLRGTIANLGFRQIGIPYKREARRAGKTKFSMGQIFHLAFDGIANHSLMPLRAASVIGIAVSILTVLMGMYFFIGKLAFEVKWPPGFTQTTILLLTSISLNALFLGIIGAYLGRIYSQVKRRPLVIIERTLNFNKDKVNVSHFR